MATPLKFMNQSNGGSYGTNSSSNKGGNARQRRNPADYGPFSSPHGSFDDPAPFPPYAELPFTSLKRRRQLQDNNSLVKWVMRAVLLSPLVVVVLWSMAAVMFANNHQIGHGNKNNNNSNSNSNNNNNNTYSNRRQSQRNSRKAPNYYGNGQNPVGMAGIPQQPLQDQQGNIIYNVNGNAMMMAPPQSQQQLQGMNNGQVMTNNLLLSNSYQQQQQQQGMIPMQPQGNTIPVLAPLGNSMNSNVIPSNNLQQGQQQVFQQLPQQAGAVINAQPQQAFMITNEVGGLQTSGMVQQQQQPMPQVNLGSSAANAMKQPSLTDSGVTEQLQQLPSDILQNNNIVEASSAMQQVPGSFGATQNQQQDSSAKEAVYFYDPKDTIMSETGQIIQMPTLVYDGYGKAIPMEEIRHVAPIYVQAPVRGDSMTSTINSDLTGVGNADSGNVLVSPSSRGASLVSPSSREASMASIPIPQSWGSSTSQDQTIIVATVAVMALLVGALSARRLRSKSFLSSCIENESLEDDLAYDDAYTTTAAASGAMGADSSYNTFGGWKGDLEKFDV